MRIIILKDYDEISKRAASIVLDKIHSKPHFVLGLDVSNTLIGTYQELINMNQEERLDFSRVVTFNLDEYLGLSATHPQSCRFFMDTHLFNHINIDKRNIYFPNGLTKDPQSLCRRYEDLIREVAGIDLQLLAVGKNGHIGFNQPGSSLSSRSRIKTLPEEMFQDRMKNFTNPENVPRFAMTMGLGTIMEARMCVMLASGERKAKALVKALEGPVSSSMPASMLQIHPNVLILADEEAAADLKQKDYYLYAEKMTDQLDCAQI